MRFFRLTLVCTTVILTSVSYAQKKDTGKLELVIPPEPNLVLSTVEEPEYDDKEYSIQPEIFALPTLSAPMEPPHEQLQLSNEILIELEPEPNNLSAVQVISYKVPLLNLSHGPSGGRVTRDYSRSVQIGCGLTYKRQYRNYRQKRYLRNKTFKGLADGSDTILKPIYNYLRPIYAGDGDHYLVSEKGRYKIVDSTGNSIDGDDYDSIYPVSKEQYRCIHHEAIHIYKKDGFLGLKRDTGDWILEPKYNFIEPMYHHWHCPENFVFYKVKEGNDFYLFKNTTGLKYIDQAFDSIKSVNRIGSDEAVSYTTPDPFILTKAYKNSKLHIFKDQELLIITEYEDINPDYYSYWENLNSYYFLKDGKWGLFSKGKELIPAKFDNIRKQNSGYRVYVDKFVGYFNNKGEQLLAPDLDGFNVLENGYFIVEKNKKQYFLDDQLKQVYEEGFDHAWRVHGGLWRSQIGELYGYIKPFQGTYLLPTIYDNNPYQVSRDWRHNYFKNGVIHTLRNGKYGLVDTLGKVIYDNNFVSQIRIYSDNDYNPIFYLLEKSEQKCIEFKDGTVLNLMKNDKLSSSFLQNNILLVTSSGKTRLYSLLHKKYVGKSYNRIIPLSAVNKDSLLYFAGVGYGKLEMYKDDSLIKSIEVDHVDRFPAGTKISYYKDFKHAVVNRDGEIITPLQYNVQQELHSKIRLIKTNDGYMFLDSNNTKKGEYFRYYTKTNDSLLVVKSGRNNKYGVYNWSAEKIIPLKYTKIKIYKDIFALKERDYSFANKQGKLLTKSIYDKVKYQFGNAVCVRNYRYFGIVDTTGKELYPYKLRVKLDIEALSKSKYKVVSTIKGKVIINDQFKELTPEESNGYYSIIKSKTNKTYFIYTSYPSSQSKIYNSEGKRLFEEYEGVQKRLIADQLLSEDYVIVQKNGLFGVITLEGDEVLPVEYERISVDKLNGKKLNLVKNGKNEDFKLK